MITKKFTRLYNEEVVVLLRDKTFNEEGPSTSASGVKQFTLFTGQMGAIVGMVRSQDDSVKYAVKFSDFETYKEYATEYIERKFLLPLDSFGLKQLDVKQGILRKVSTKLSTLVPFVRGHSREKLEETDFSLPTTSLFTPEEYSLLESTLLALPLEDDYVHTEQLDEVDEAYYNFEKEILSIENEAEFKEKYDQFFEMYKIHYKRYLDFDFNEGDLVTIKSDIVDENDNKNIISAGQVGMIINPEDPSKLQANHVQVVFRPLAFNQFISYRDILIREGKTTLAPLPGISESVNKKLNFEVRGQVHKGLLLPLYGKILEDSISTEI